jgi:CRISPR-associated protein (TIGR02584 family)
MSPAILTETVWALAHEAPPVIPDEVVVITTKRGRADLERDLFKAASAWGEKTVWHALRENVLGDSAAEDPRLDFQPLRVITAGNPATGRAVELDDIRTAAHNAAAARCIVEEVRRITANDDLRLVASLAGGRKTMGALLHAAVSLLGRRGDRLTHILVNDPFDSPALRPKFFFPGQPDGDHTVTAAGGGSQPVRNSDAVLELADVPFAALHEVFRKHLGKLPGDILELGRTATGLVEELTAPVTIECSMRPGDSKCIPLIDGIPIELSGRDISFFLFLFEQAKAGRLPYPSHLDAYDDFLDFLENWMPKHPVVNLQFGETDWRDPKHRPNVDHLRKRVDSLRTRLVSAGLAQHIPVLFPIRGPLGWPLDRVRIS